MDRQPDLRTGVSLVPTKQIPLPAVIDLARLAEGLGYDSIWVPETWGFDAVSLLALLAERTERIKLASGVLNVFSRSAALIAQTTASLQEISGGRFLLGLGTSGPGVVEPWHGISFTAPVTRTREYLEIIRLALGGERVDHAGSLFQLVGFKLQNPPKQTVPIYIAALGPKNVELTGEVADGWLPIFAARGQLAGLAQHLAAGASRAGRNPSEIDVASFLPACIAEEGDTLLRQHLAYYIGGMGTFYAEFARQMGFESEVTAVRDRWQSGDRAGAVKAVDDVLLDACTLGSAESEARSRLQTYRDEGMELPILTLPHAASLQTAADTLESLAPYNSA